jgi:hypothetical protein
LYESAYCLSPAVGPVPGGVVGGGVFDALGLELALGLGLVLASGVDEPDGTGSLAVSSGCTSVGDAPAAGEPECPLWTMSATTAASTTTAAPIAVASTHLLPPPVRVRCRVTR